jgi:DNA polymerase III alpha subunit (gram-positive type)
MSYIAFDCETTGLLPECQVLTAYFIVLDHHLNEIDSLDLRIKYDMYNIQSKALEINKIDLLLHDSLAKDVLDSKLLLEAFVRRNCKQRRLIPLGHNITFDINMLKTSGILSPGTYNECFSYNVLDTIVIAQFLKLLDKLPKNYSVSLSSLCKYFNVDSVQGLELHNSECDIKMTVNLLKAMTRQCEFDVNEVLVTGKKRKM